MLETQFELLVYGEGQVGELAPDSFELFIYAVNKFGVVLDDVFAALFAFNKY